MPPLHGTLRFAVPLLEGKEIAGDVPLKVINDGEVTALAAVQKIHVARAEEGRRRSERQVQKTFCFFVGFWGDLLVIGLVFCGFSGFSMVF